jgi:hypothetical protein
MMLNKRATLVLQIGVASAATNRQINGTASPGNFIVAEQDVDFSGVMVAGTTIDVTSPIPVTVQRYNGGGRFVMEQEPRKLLLLSK